MDVDASKPHVSSRLAAAIEIPVAAVAATKLLAAAGSSVDQDSSSLAAGRDEATNAGKDAVVPDLAFESDRLNIF
jgi:hypothetical protein